MQDIRLGGAIRALRRRRLWRQADLAAAAGVSQTLVSVVERGHLDGVAIGTLRSVLAGLDARVELNVRWRGGALDRLLDERHASLVGRVTEVLQTASWVVRVEASYAHYGERGSVDVLASTRPPGPCSSWRSNQSSHRSRRPSGSSMKKSAWPESRPANKAGRWSGRLD